MILLREPIWTVQGFTLLHQEKCFASTIIISIRNNESQILSKLLAENTNVNIFLDILKCS